MRTTALDDTDTYIQALHAYVQDAPVHRLVEAFRTSAEPSYTKLVPTARNGMAYTDAEL